jgi:predicted acylesterase/phospholipase RssA
MGVLNVQRCKNKKLISISPGGLKGFYEMGVLSYIKDNYDMEDYIFSGASAGAWNALFMCYKDDSKKFVYNLLDYKVTQINNIKQLKYFLHLFSFKTPI